MEGEFEQGKLLGTGTIGHSYVASLKGHGECSHVLKHFSLRRDAELDFAKLRVSSPAILEITDLSKDAEKACCVTPYVRAESLQTLVRERFDACDITTKLKIMLGVASALKTLHHHGVVHGDLKPTNVFYDELRGPLVADYGLANVAKLGTITQSAFRAPELAKGDRADEQCDAYSFGMLCYFLLGGKVPHGRQVQHLVEGLRPELPKTFPHDLRKIIHLCWSQEPKSRPSFDSIVSMLLDARIRDSEFDADEFIQYAKKVEPDSVKRKRRGKMEDLVEKLMETIETQNRRIESLECQLSRISALERRMDTLYDSIGTTVTKMELDGVRDSVQELRRECEMFVTKDEMQNIAQQWKDLKEADCDQFHEEEEMKAKVTDQLTSDMRISSLIKLVGEDELEEFLFSSESSM